jgi:hypothetical protein
MITPHRASVSIGDGQGGFIPIGEVSSIIAHSMRVDDRVSFSNDANRIRRRVVAVDSATSFRTETFVRPSRGFARHVRRMKQGRVTK